MTLDYVKPTLDVDVNDDEIDESLFNELLGNTGAKGKGKNAKRNEKKKLQKQQRREQKVDEKDLAADVPKVSVTVSNEIVDYVEPSIDSIDNPELKDIMVKFLNLSKAKKGIEVLPESKSSEPATDEDDFEKDVLNELALASRPRDKLSYRMRGKVCEQLLPILKRETNRPEIVESHDVNSPDPFLLLHLKSLRNTVPVPRHWNHKRKYLQGKRGIVRPPFQLPDFITATGITKIRDADLAAQDAKTLKQKTRELIRPKMGRVELDYQVLHDAFFKYQTKPKMSTFGDIYYEGKEFEMDRPDVVPGKLSERLRDALGMGDNPLVPPPWLKKMQIFGPPPAYRTMRIPGLNCPIPAGARYGNAPGEWGMPPVDSHGNALYGNPFDPPDVDPNSMNPEGSGFGGAIKYFWGESVTRAVTYDKEGRLVTTTEAASEHMQDDRADEVDIIAQIEGNTLVLPESESESSEEEEAEKVTEKADKAQPEVVLSFEDAKVQTPESLLLHSTAESKIASIAEARKNKTLYTVLEQKSTSGSDGLMAGRHIYQLPAEGEGANVLSLAEGESTIGGVEVNINPDEMGSLSQRDILKKAEGSTSGSEEINMAKRKRPLDADKPSKSKKSKDFKF